MTATQGTDPIGPKADPALRSVHARWSRDILRYRDTDRQGHVNNAVFATFLESGRVAFLYDPRQPLAPEGASFVIARLVLDFRAEVNWPGSVDIGTTVMRIGGKSLTLSQGVFVGESCVATAETIIVLMDDATRKARPITPEMRERLNELGYRNADSGG